MTKITYYHIDADKAGEALNVYKEGRSHGAFLRLDYEEPYNEASHGGARWTFTPRMTNHAYSLEQVERFVSVGRAVEIPACKARKLYTKRTGLPFKQPKD